MFCSKCGAENNNNIVCSKCGSKLKKLNSKIIAIISIMFIFVTVALPMATNNLVDDKIAQKTKQLKDIGIDLEVISSTGYISSTKEIELKINNGRYFATSVLAEIGNLSGTGLKTILKALGNSNTDWEALLNGTILKGKLTTHNYFLSQPKLEIFIEKLSYELMNKIHQNNEDSKLILPLLDKKTINISLTYSRTGILERIELKNIDETFFVNDDRMVFQLFDNNYEKGLLSIDRAYLSVKNDGEVTVLQFDSIESLFKDNNSFEINIGNISFIADKFKFKAQNLNFRRKKNDTTTKVGFLQNTSIENIKIEQAMSPVSIGRISYSFGLDDMAKTQFYQILEDYKNKSGDIASYSDYETKNIINLLNEGFTLKIDANVEDLKVKELYSGKYSFKTNMKINRNNLNLIGVDYNQVVGSIESTGKAENSIASFEIDKESAKFIANNNKAIRLIIENFGYLENEKYSFELLKRDGDLLLNNFDREVSFDEFANDFLGYVETKPVTKQDKQSYALGASMGRYLDKNLKKNAELGINLDQELIVGGIREALNGKLQLTDEHINEIMTLLEEKVKKAKKAKDNLGDSNSRK